MDKKKIAIGFVFILIFVTFSGCYDYDDYQDYMNEDDNSNDNHNNNDNPPSTYEPFKIACWNLQMYGQAKAHNETILEYYAEKLNNYDVFIIQEVMDNKGSAVNALAKRLPKGYKSIISRRAGPILSKREQYSIFYNSRVSLISYQDFTDDLNKQFHRPPFSATFLAENWTFTIYTLHANPENVAGELTNLENFIDNPKEDVIIMGTLYADGEYYNENNISHFKDWIWVVKNDEDTTVTSDNNTYDRIIMTTHATNNYERYGIMDDVILEQSDHYLLYAVFNSEVR